MDNKKNRKRLARPIPEENRQFIDRYGLLCLVSVLLLALLVRVIAMIDLSGSIYFDFLLWDERIYHEWAIKIADGTFTSKTIYEFAPLFAYVTALLYKIFAPNVIYIRFLNIILGVVLCWLVYLIGLALAGRKIGLIASLVACFYEPFIIYSIVPLKETLSACLFAVIIYFLLIISDDQSNKKNGTIGNSNLLRRNYAIKLVSLGLAAGFLINIRPNAVVILPVIFFLMLWYACRDRLSLRKTSLMLFLYAMGIIIALSPFLIRNYQVAGKIALSTSQGGFNLYLGNNLKNPDPYYRPVPFASSSPFEQGIQFTIEASRRSGKKLTSDEASTYWTKEVIKEAADKPGAFAWKLWLKMLVLVNRFEACDHYDTDFMSNFIRSFRFPFFSFWLIFPFGLTGMIIGSYGSRKIRMVSMVLAAYALTLVVFFTNARYRLPMLTILIPCAALGVKFVVKAVREKNKKKACMYIALVLVFLIVENIPVRATDDKTAYYNTHAIIMNKRGFQNEAMYYWNISSKMNRPFSSFANISLARIYFQKGDMSRGYEYLSKISDDSFAAAEKYNLIGDLLYRQNRLPLAAAAYEKSLSINSGQRRTLKKLIQLYRSLDTEKLPGTENRLKYITSFYDIR
jgi:4-amino-4-deoxy-L-arabinose transferase-like glycosyltransferase